MATATATEEKAKKEGSGLLGPPSFTELGNGRLKCVETGHEMLPKDKDLYLSSKRCRFGLIDFALLHNNPPLNMFKQDPSCRSKLICKLTGDTVNKSEEHIWKHINGKQFLNKLEQKEKGSLSSNGDLVEEGEKLGKESKISSDDVKHMKKKMKKEKAIEEIIYAVRESLDKDSDSGDADFWMPPVGDRWDFDDGGDRWGSGSESDEGNDEENETDGAVENGEKESVELSARTKRMSIEVGPSSFASRKKKSRKDTAS
ncbi:SURF2 domain-containing protein [Cephalotus follicularis]|uniref:SURF2 domain-containing protein n=1 Tax=Cephalotus follicularis TaxID=3775 RepID=A0A1Q3CWI7_CEPFO|nr:SURF2 domain-containing protein [Cephalotus follicularis]